MAYILKDVDDKGINYCIVNKRV